MSFSFKASEVAPSENNDFSPITAGQYTVQFQDIQEKETKSGGLQWSALLKITGGAKFVGRTFWINWNVVNSSEKAQEIARREIAQIAAMIGTGDDISIETLRTNAHFDITLDVGEYLGKPQYNVKKWALHSEAAKTPNFVTKTTAPAAKPAAPAAKKQPWAK